MQAEPINVLRMEFSSKAENVAFARTATAVFASQCDFTLEQIEDIRIAISEAVSNAIIHGYKHAPGMVRMELRLYPDSLEAIVSDDGVGIADIEWAMQPGRTTDASRMGLGLMFIKEYMDEMALISSLGSGTQVVMRKKVAQQPTH